MYKIISEEEFKNKFIDCLYIFKRIYMQGSLVKYVSGPGRSGAIASVYASHYLKIPFIPYKSDLLRQEVNTTLVVDTACYTGETVRKYMRWCRTVYNVVPFAEDGRSNFVKFWYEDF